MRLPTSVRFIIIIAATIIISSGNRSSCIAEEESRTGVALPGQFDARYFRPLSIAIQITAATAADQAYATHLQTRLRGELGRDRRFRLPLPGNDQEVDFILQGTVRSSVDTSRNGRTISSHYNVSCDLACHDQLAQSIRFTVQADGRSLRERRLDRREFVGELTAIDPNLGFNNAASQAATLAAELFRDRFSQQFPVGGQVTAFTDKQFRLAAGSDHGISPGMHLVVYAHGATEMIPLALATARPGSDSSSLQVRRWNTGSVAAEVLIAQLQNSGQWPQDISLWAVQVRF